MNTPKPSNKATKRLFKIFLLIVGSISALFLAVLLLTIGSFVVSKVTTNIKFDHATTRCKGEPTVLIKDTSTIESDSTSYDLYTSLNPSYNTVKKEVANPISLFGTGSVYGYYCSPQEAKAAFAKINDPNGGGGLVDSASNYPAQVNQAKVKQYLEAQKNKGEVFYVPGMQLSGFKVKSQTVGKFYEVDYVLINPRPGNEDDYYIDNIGPVNLTCGMDDQSITDSFIPQLQIGTNSSGGGIYDTGVEGDSTLYIKLPGSACSFYYDKNHISDKVALQYIMALKTTDISTIESYSLSQN